MIAAALALWSRPIVQAVAVGLLAVMVLACIGLLLAWRGEQVAHAKTKVEAAEREATWQAASASAERRARAFEDLLQRQADRSRERDREHQQIITQQAGNILALQARIVRLDADAVRLRGNLSAYAAGAGTADSLVACQQRASRLADLLAEGASLLGESSQLVAEGASLAVEGGRAAQQRASELDACVATFSEPKQ